MEEEIKSYKDLIVWQKAMSLVIEVYKLTENFPKTEIFGLTGQMRRCSISIPSNIAEGRGRGTKKDFVNFLRMSLGSTNELETQIEMSKRLFLNRIFNYDLIDSLIIEILKMLKTMVNRLSC